MALALLGVPWSRAADPPVFVDPRSNAPPRPLGDRVQVQVATLAYVPRRDEIPAEGRAPPPGGRSLPAEADRPDFLGRLAEAINVYRHAQGLAPLQSDADLAALAAAHSLRMADAVRLSHDGFRDRLLGAHSRLCVENVAHNFRTVDGLLQGWQASPGHLRNLLEPEVARMGLATQDRYVTLFACR